MAAPVPSSEAEALIDAVDEVVLRYGGERFYAERKTHFSVGWSLKAMPLPLPRIGEGAACAHHPVTANRVVCRIGERETTFELSAAVR
jgi:EAL domain-containing protein (putative c-di-GMP-specific phosphodiesterase class I)